MVEAMGGKVGGATSYPERRILKRQLIEFFPHEAVRRSVMNASIHSGSQTSEPMVTLWNSESALSLHTNTPMSLL